MNFGLRRDEEVEAALQLLPRSSRSELVAVMIRLCQDPRGLSKPATHTAANSYVYNYVARDGRLSSILFDIDDEAHAIFVWDFVPREGHRGK
jgi:hypothetical protein